MIQHNIKRCMRSAALAERHTPPRTRLVRSYPIVEQTYVEPGQNLQKAKLCFSGRGSCVAHKYKNPPESTSGKKSYVFSK